MKRFLDSARSSSLCLWNEQRLKYVCRCLTVCGVQTWRHAPQSLTVEPAETVIFMIVITVIWARGCDINQRTRGRRWIWAVLFEHRELLWESLCGNMSSWWTRTETQLLRYILNMFLMEWYNYVFAAENEPWNEPKVNLCDIWSMSPWVTVNRDVSSFSISCDHIIITLYSTKFLTNKAEPGG